MYGNNNNDYVSGRTSKYNQHGANSGSKTGMAILDSRGQLVSHSPKDDSTNTAGGQERNFN